MPAIFNSRKGDLVVCGITFKGRSATDVTDEKLRELAEHHVFRRWAKQGLLAPVKYSPKQLAALEAEAKAKAEAAELARQKAHEDSLLDEQGRTAAERDAQMQAEVDAANARIAGGKAADTGSSSPETSNPQAHGSSGPKAPSAGKQADTTKAK